MLKFSSFTLVAIVLFFGACKRKDAEVSSVARAQAAKYVADAQMQALLKDYAGAAKLLTQAVELDPNQAVYWSGLGVNRVMTGDMSGAKKAYKRQLEIVESEAKKAPKDIDAQLAQMAPLVVLGRADDARKLLEKLGRENPDNFALKQLIATHPVDNLLANPKVKEAMIK